MGWGEKNCGSRGEVDQGEWLLGVRRGTVRGWWRLGCVYRAAIFELFGGNGGGVVEFKRKGAEAEAEAEELELLVLD